MNRHSRGRPHLEPFVARVLVSGVVAGLATMLIERGAAPRSGMLNQMYGDVATFSMGLFALTGIVASLSPRRALRDLPDLAASVVHADHATVQLVTRHTLTLPLYATLLSIGGRLAVGRGVRVAGVDTEWLRPLANFIVLLLVLLASTMALGLVRERSRFDELAEG